MVEVTTLVETAPHEFAANFLYTDDGLAPFFACDSRVKEGGGSQQSTFSYEGESWKVTLSYRNSGLEHPGQRLPDGTPFDLEAMREFDLTIRGVDDSVGQRSFHVHIAPRWKGMRSKAGNEITVPDDIASGVNLHVQGSNIEFDHYRPLIAEAASAVDIRHDYFANPHEYSTVLDAERYVRLHREVSGPVHARDGPIAQLGYLLENDREGRRKLVQYDSNERMENVPGYYHTATLGPQRVREVFPSHDLPKEVKHYYAREAVSLDPDEALAHPKVGASYQRSFWKGKLGVSPESLEHLNRELEETVLSVLAEAGIPVRPGMGSYVEDAYFRAVESDRERSVFELDLTRIQHRQESVVIKHIADGLSPTAWDSLRVLVTDGGTVSPQDIADETGRHPGSVRRALNRIPELVERKYGQVSLRSDYVASLVYDAVEEAKEATRRAVETGAKAIEAAERGLDESTSAFIAWAAKYDIDISDRASSDSLTLDLGRVDDIRRKIREGYRLWTAAGRSPIDFRTAKVQFTGEVGAKGRTFDHSRERTCFAKAWHYLR